MTASDLFHAGNLDEAIEAQIAAVKKKPADDALRLFLFELLSFQGDWERAKKHLDVLNYDDLELAAALEKYKNLLAAAVQREKVFAGTAEPSSLLEPSEHVKKRFAAWQLLKAGKDQEGLALIEEANEAIPELTGEFKIQDSDPIPFTGFRDCDDFFAGIVEFMTAQGGYYWMGWEQVDMLMSNPPRYPRDLLWMPTRLDVKNGPSGEIFLPTIYPGSQNDEDDQVRLGRLTNWIEEPNRPILGIGAHLWLIGDEACSVLDVREIVFEEDMEEEAETESE
ncbi:Type VI secretion system protein ImpE [Planctomycetales bacterium 10988]|nr:Type VI secretion system protein ImpE [Planctomycetales bacterium 10988]